MLPLTITVQLAAADDNGICESQTPAGAGDLDIDGVLASGGVATLTEAGYARQVLITAVGDNSARTFTIYGTDPNGFAISEQVTGPDGSPTTATTVQWFRTVTRVAIDGAAAGAIIVGTNGVGGSRPLALDQWASGATALQVDVDGTANFTVQQTLDDLNDISPEFVDWINHPDTDLAGATASAQGNYAYAPGYVRLQINSGTDPVTLSIRQALY